MKKEKVVCTVCKAKNTFIIPKSQLGIEEELYSDFCPTYESIVKNHMLYLQKCEKCGYVFSRIDEDTKISRQIIKSDRYQFPLGKEFTGDENAVLCCRTALIYREIKCYRLAAKWFIRTAVLLEREEETLKRICFQNAVLLLKRVLDESDKNMDFELQIAYLNTMRLAGMFDIVKETGTKIKYRYEDIDRKLLEKVLELAAKGNRNYITFWEMFFMEY